MSGNAPNPGVAVRRVAADALDRIDAGGAYANLVLGEILDRAKLERRDAALVTELVYGSTRMRRALDHRMAPFIFDELEPRVRNLLRLGVYQLDHTSIPSHAAVDATVGAAPKRVRNLMNAVLRRVDRAEIVYPSDAVAWSYPDWIVEALRADLGREDADASLLAMNERASTHVREDGYVQDRASAAVVDALEIAPGERVLDLCAAPGGKATDLASRGATVWAFDRRPSRARLLRRNIRRLDAAIPVGLADGAAPPVRPGSMDAVLIDAPCSGLGSLRRRADARWRIDADAPERLGRLQTELVIAAADTLRSGGRLVYSVCTMTRAELDEVAAAVVAARPDLTPIEAYPGADRVDTTGPAPVARYLPGEDDGMGVVRFTRR